MKKKVIIVEDDFIIKLFISKVLGDNGYDVVGEATSCKQLMEILNNQFPDLILMDIGIAGPIDGIDTVKLLHDMGNFQIIYMTGNSDDATIERAMETRPLGIIFKPIDEVKLLRKLEELCALI